MNSHKFSPTDDKEEASGASGFGRFVENNERASAGSRQRGGREERTARSSSGILLPSAGDPTSLRDSGESSVVVVVVVEPLAPAP